jgi:metallo-beta-lactamase family protein
MHLQTIGAARSVTGSMHLLEVNGKRILMDCGLFQGHREEAYKKNRHLPFPVNSIDAVILSHAHIDHSGNLPSLVRLGYRGPIFATFATRDLCSSMLQDSAKLQEKDLEYINNRRVKKGLPLFNPLYSLGDVIQTIQLFKGLGFDTPHELFPGINLTFRKAGHILGAAMVELNLQEEGKESRFVYTGDLGRKDMPILPDPYQFDSTNVLLMESTYGNRIHEPMEDIDQQLEALIKEAVEKKSKIIIPAFAVDRTQTFVYRLHKLCNENRCAHIPIYVDSPLALNVTEAYRLHTESLDEETIQFMTENGDPFGFDRLTYIRSSQESKHLNTYKGPLIIISASGMCEGGRILHHLRNNIEDPNNIILMIGYVAEHTLGRKILDREPIVKILGESHQLNAKVVMINSLSGHADKNELLSFVKGFQKHPDKIFIVHGEESQSLAFAQTLKESGYVDVTVPHPEEGFEITPA